jgi:hypothetical protein
MRKLFPALLLLLALPATSHAFGVNQCDASQGTTFTWGGSINGTAPVSLPSGTINCVEIDLPASAATLTVGVTGSSSATFAPEESQDNQVTWTSAGVPITTNGTYTYVVSAFTNFRIRATAFSSGIANIHFQASIASSTGVSSLNGLTGALSLTSTGATVTITPSGNTIDLETSGSGLALEVNGTPNGSQTLLNLAQGSGITVTDNGSGTVTIASSGSAPAFSAITSGTNTAAAMVLGSGSSLTVSGTGTITSALAHGTAALGTSAIASGACATVVTATATGVATTDNIMADFNADPTSTTGYAPSAAGILTIIKYPTSGNVNFKVCNNSAASITPGAVTLNWRVVR